MENPVYILIAAQDAALVRSLSLKLKAWGYTPILANSPDVMMKSLNRGVRLALIGSRFYNRSGLEWIHLIRRTSTIPAFILGLPDDLVLLKDAIEAGADDVINYPFNPDLLQIRITSVLRRTYEYAGEKEVSIGRGLSYSLETGVLRYQDEIIDLTRTEQKILDILTQNKGKAVTRGDLMEALWKTSEYICDGTLSTSVSRLRSKLRQVSSQKVIQTRKGIGYIIP